MCLIRIYQFIFCYKVLLDLLPKILLLYIVCNVTDFKHFTLALDDG